MAKRSRSDGLRPVQDFIVFVARIAASARQRQRLNTAAQLSATEAEVNALRTVKAHGPCTVTALAERVGLDRTTVSRTATRLESTGLINRQTDDQDRRQSWIEVAPAGDELLNRLSDVSMNDFVVATSEWSSTEIQELGLTVERLHDCLSRLRFDESGWAIGLAKPAGERTSEGTDTKSRQRKT